MAIILPLLYFFVLIGLIIYNSYIRHPLLITTQRRYIIKKTFYKLFRNRSKKYGLVRVSLANLRVPYQKVKKQAG